MKKSKVLLMLVAGIAIAMFCSRSAWAQNALAYYPFDDDTLTDKSPSGGHDGTGGSTFVDAAAGFGRAYDVSAGSHIVLANPADFFGYGGEDGFNSHASAGSPPDTVAAAAGSPASVAMRFYPNGSNESVLMGFGTGGTRFHFAQRTSGSASQVMRLEFGGGAYRSMDTPNGSFLSNRWYTAVATQDGVPGSGWTLHMQEDGGAVQTYSTLSQGNSNHPNAGAGTDNTNEFTRHIDGGTVEIGGLPGISDSIDWSGLVDDFAFFGYELAPVQVNAILAGNLASVADGTILPEPSSLALLLLCGLSLVSLRRR